MRNPIRRSRNIGKTQGGRVKGGKAVEKASRIFTQDIWTKLSEEGGKWRVLRENPSSEYFHPCSGEDYIAVLKRLPPKLTSSVKAIVLRRSPDLDVDRGIEARMRYRCVIMNSFPTSMKMHFGGAVSKTTLRHYAPWCRSWWQDSNGDVLWWGLQDLRRYYLYHLFLHEVGHVNQPRYANRRQEEFAENFALEWARELGELILDYDTAYEKLVLELEQSKRDPDS